MRRDRAPRPLFSHKPFMSSLPPDDDRTVIRPSTGPSPVQPARPATAGDRGLTLPIGSFLGEFELTDLLGEGGFGIVYLAWDHSLQRKVALKEYMPSALATRGESSLVQVRSERHRDTFDAGLKSFVNEARLLAQFDHPSLVKVYRFWEANGTAYMVMPFYEGVTLKDRLKALGHPPDENWLIELLAPLTEALTVIHRENCFHRDIAPDNVILLAGNGRPLLLDFGAARRVIGDMTQALTVILKPGYAPIEQYAEAPGMKQGPWTDVYALAASIYYAIQGRTPPPSVGRLVDDSYVPLQQVCAGRYSEHFLVAIDKALRVRPEQRTQSIEELRADLGLGSQAAPVLTTRLLDSVPPATAAPSPRPPATATAVAAAPRSRSLLWPALGGSSLLLAAVGAYLVLTPGAPAPKPVTDAAPAAAVAVPAVVESTPAPAAAPPSFDIDREIAQVLSAQTPGFELSARPDKPLLRIDKDSLGFTLKSPREGHVTVLVHGPDGSLLRLIPSAEMRDVRIARGQTLRLPPPKVLIGVSEPAGREQFLVIVSSQPRDYAAISSRVEGGYLLLPTGAEAAALKAGRNSALPMLLGEAKGCGNGNSSDVVGCNDYGAARFEIDVQP